MGRALISLLKQERIRAVVVGDPDQAIYEFGGANPSLFFGIEKLDGAKTLPLTKTQRCATRIAAVASALSDSDSTVVPREGAPAGKATILVHKMRAVSPDPVLLSQIKLLTRDDTSVAILARRNLTIRRLETAQSDPGFPGSSRLGGALDRAAWLLRTGQSSKAAKLVAQELGAIVLGDEVPTREKITAANISLRQWKESICSIVKTATESTAPDWNSWLSEQKECMETHVQILTSSKQPLGARFRKGKKTVLRTTNAKPQSNPVWENKFCPVTIHRAKGAEFSAVILFCPKPHASLAPCPSTEWWQASPSEEKRIAYVAVTRAEENLIICIHEETYQELQSNHPEFLSLFSVLLLGNDPEVNA